MKGRIFSRNRDPPRLMTVDPMFDYQFRIILIGDSTVGKSSLLHFFTDGTAAGVCDPTVGIDFFYRHIQVDDGKTIKLLIWDSAGQERFRTITRSYYRNTVGALLVYDICNRESFNHIPFWMAEAQKYTGFSESIFVLVGCKSDLTDSNPASREVTEEEARIYAEMHNLKFVETSALTGSKVEDSFRLLTQEIYDRILNKKIELDPTWDGIKLGHFSQKYQFIRSFSDNDPRGRTSNSSGSRYRVGEPVRDKCCFF